MRVLAAGVGFVAVALNYTAAYQILHRVAKICARQVVLVHNAAGGVGSVLVEFAHVQSLRVYGTASAPKHDFVRQRGAIPADHQKQDFVREKRRHEPNGVDYVLAGLGYRRWPSWRLVRRGAKILTQCFINHPIKYGDPMTTLILRTIVFVSLVVAQSPQQAWSKPKYGPPWAPRAITLALDHAYLQSRLHQAPDYWALTGYYVPQIGPAACSAASLAMVLNAARARIPKTSEETLITQEALIEKIKIDCWDERVTNGCKGQYGAPLDLMAKVTEAVFVQYGFPRVKVRAVHVPDASFRVRRALIADLRANEQSSRDFIIANFDQKAFTDDFSVGHMAPLAAFDEEHSRVLVMDPDREWYEPYWVSVDTLLDGLATSDSETGAPRGYLVIEL